MVLVNTTPSLIIAIECAHWFDRGGLMFHVATNGFERRMGTHTHTHTLGEDTAMHLISIPMTNFDVLRLGAGLSI